MLRLSGSARRLSTASAADVAMLAHLPEVIAAREMLAAGQLSKAVPLLQHGHGIIASSMGESHPLTCHLSSSLGWTLSHLGDYKAALPHHQCVWKAAVEGLGSGAPSAATLQHATALHVCSQRVASDPKQSIDPAVHDVLLSGPGASELRDALAQANAGHLLACGLPSGSMACGQDGMQYPPLLASTDTLKGLSAFECFSTSSTDSPTEHASIHVEHLSAWNLAVQRFRDARAALNSDESGGLVEGGGALGDDATGLGTSYGRALAGVGEGLMLCAINGAGSVDVGNSVVPAEDLLETSVAYLSSSMKLLEAEAAQVPAAMASALIPQEGHTPSLQLFRPVVDDQMATALLLCHSVSLMAQVHAMKRSITIAEGLFNGSLDILKRVKLMESQWPGCKRFYGTLAHSMGVSTNLRFAAFLHSRGRSSEAEKQLKKAAEWHEEHEDAQKALFVLV